MNHLKSMTQAEISQVLKDLGQPAFRAKQVYTWLHKGVRSYAEMTNLPQSLRDRLEEQYPICPPQVARKQVSKYEGMVMDALVEEMNEHENTQVTGRLSNNTIVHFPGDASLIGQIVDVQLDECHGFYYMGHRVEK